MYAWSPALAFPYETTWSILQKLTLLNHTKQLPLLRTVSATHIVVQSYYSSSWRSLGFANTEWIAVGVRHRAGLPPISNAGMELQGELLRHGGQVYLGSLAKRLVTRILRVCPECIALGFHCIAHQIEGLRRCPIHNIDLVSSCPSCGSSLQMFEPCARFSAFRCPKCKKSLMNDAVPRPASEEVRAQVMTHIEPLISWLHSFQSELIAWPAIPHDLVLRAESSNPRCITTFRAGILWAFHAYRPYQGDVTSFGPRPLRFSLISTGGSGDVDVWDEAFRDLSLVAMQKRVETMHAFVMAVIKEERSVIAKIAEKRGDLCSPMRRLLEALIAKQDDAFLLPSDGYCGYAHMFHQWESFLIRGLNALIRSVRSGWLPVMDAFYREVIRHDMRSALSMSAQITMYQQDNRYSESDIFRMRLDPGGSPFFSINGDRSSLSHSGIYGPSALIFIWADDADFINISCGHNYLLEMRRDRQRALMDEMENYRKRKRMVESDVSVCPSEKGRSNP